MLRLSEPVPADVELFLLVLEPAAPIPDADWAVLSEDEGDRALRFRQHADRVRFVRTRATLRRVLATRLRSRPEALRFSAGGHGKPRLKARSMHFNVSHAGEHALIALSAQRAVGVDIERRDPQLDVASLATQVLSPLERQLEDVQRLDFFETWVAKEAVLKLLGLGVAEYLQNISVMTPEVSGDARYRLCSDANGWPELVACRLKAPEGYSAALAWCGRGGGCGDAGGEGADGHGASGQCDE